MKCPYCNSENIEESIAVLNELNPEMNLGLMYRKNQFAYEFKQIYADLCIDCGTIVRTYVKGDIKDKKWEKENWRRV